MVIKPSDLDGPLEWLEERLVAEGVPFRSVAAITERLRDRLVGIKIKGDWEKQVKTRLKEALKEMFKPAPHLLDQPFNTILLVGPNGVGKTTLAAHVCKNRGAVLVEADTFRAGAKSQAQELGRRMGIDVFTDGDRPSSVVVKALKMDKPLVIDTGGRQESQYDLMKELKKIVKLAKPDGILMVAEATTGGALMDQLTGFSGIGVDELVLTKADVGKIGGVLTAAVSGVPVGYLFYGDTYKRFEPDQFVDGLFEEKKKGWFGLW